MPPCWLRDDRYVQAALSMPHDLSGRREAGEIVQRLLAAGLSRYEFDPLGALARREAERTRRASSEVSKAEERDTADVEPVTTPGPSA